ncbi:MAG: hypothetical protein WBG50_14450, partial [Desulfomonilaceae bacterium]
TGLLSIAPMGLKRKRPGGTRDSSPVIHCRERGSSCHESRPHLHFETVSHWRRLMKHRRGGRSYWIPPYAGMTINTLD